MCQRECCGSGHQITSPDFLLTDLTPVRLYLPTEVETRSGWRKQSKKPENSKAGNDVKDTFAFELTSLFYSVSLCFIRALGEFSRGPSQIRNWVIFPPPLAEWVVGAKETRIRK